MKYIFGIAFLFFSGSLKGQVKQGVGIHIVPYFKSQPVKLNDVYYHITAIDSVVFETFKCYISGIAFKSSGKKVFTEKGSYHLIDAENGSSMNFVVPVPADLSFDEIDFYLGIDSLTNVSGALGGDLDPSKGMYWTWQSGYINFKLEGKSNLCTTRRNEFHLHLGGYSGADNALQMVCLKVPQTREITIALPLDKFLSKVDLAKRNAVMIPGKQAVELSHIVSRLFEVVRE